MMDKERANILLNAVRQGANVSEWRIVEALKATGDIEELSDYPVVRHRPAGTWEMRSRGLAPALWSQVIAA